MPELLSDAAIERELAALPGWDRQGGEILKCFALPSFPDAISFLVRVGFLAEAANHHPDLDIRWRNVTVSLSTHDAGGLTAADLDLARRVEALGASA